MGEETRKRRTYSGANCNTVECRFSVNANCFLKCISEEENSTQPATEGGGGTIRESSIILNITLHYIRFPGSKVSQNDCRIWNKSYKYKNTYTAHFKHSKNIEDRVLKLGLFQS
jgi:hypothetical protein